MTENFPPDTPFEIIELGEDSDTWMAKGYAYSDAAFMAVKKWVKSAVGDDEYEGEFAEPFKTAKATYREDWYFTPATDVEGALLNATDDPIKPFHGFLIEIDR